MKARLVLLATMFVAVVLNACGDPTNIKASLPTSVDTLSVFALTGTPPAYPSGVAIVARRPVRVDGFANFDVAFDINSSGNAVIYPVRLVVPSPSGSRPVALQMVAGAFDAVAEAPKTGFADSALVMLPGDVVVVQTAHNTSGDICQFALNPNLFAKFVVDSINQASRTIYLKMGFDPNCGFRSFATGIPTS